MRILTTMMASAAMLTMAGCESMSPSERNAAIGAGVGGAAGYALGGDAGSAALGAVVGGAGGWYLGCRQEGRCGAVDNRREHRDARTGRYYFQDPQSGQYFYENGEPYHG